MMRLISALFALGLIVICGCIEEKNEFYINPDGSGKVVRELTLSQMDMGMNMPGQPPMNTQIQAEQTARAMIEQARGVEAWSDVSYGLTEDGKMHFKGTAFFPDINHLVLGGMEAEHQSGFMLTHNSDGTIMLQQKQQQSAQEPGQPMMPMMPQSPDVDPNQMDAMVQQTKMQYQQSRVMMQGFFAGFKVEQIFHLPGAIRESNNVATVDEATAKIEITGEQILKVMDEVMSDDALLKTQLAEGKDPTRQLDPNTMNEKMFGQAGPVRIVSDANAPLFDYQKESAAAKKEYQKLLKKFEAAPADMATDERPFIQPAPMQAEPDELAVADYNRPVRLQLRDAFEKRREDDIDGAIEVYRAVIANTSATENELARAHLNLGKCYFDQDDTAKATEVFEKLIADLPDQEIYVKRAQTELKRIAFLEKTKKDGDAKQSEDAD